jgi:GTP cyclohydrolase I/GTP cyclohydrolase-4
METALRTTVDVQGSRPSIEVSLSRVGVTGVEKVIRLGEAADRKVVSVALECVVDLNARQKGAHMSRFEEAVNDVLGEIVPTAANMRLEQLARRIAEKVRERQDALRAEVVLSARYPEYKRAPVSRVLTQEIYTLRGRAVASDCGTRRVVGVSAQGMTACPCAQEQLAEGARVRLRELGYADDEISRILDAVPVASHNQRGVGTLYIGCPETCSADIDASELVEIVEQSMSSEIYELMKRCDEAAVVERAHRQTRFVEDCVREMVWRAAQQLDHLTDAHFVSAQQVNMETIHQHNVIAERFGLFGEIRHELATGEHVAHHTTLRAWLDS